MTDGEAREMARELVRGSIIEDAASQFIAQILKHTHDERVKPLRKQVAALDAKLTKVVEALPRWILAMGDWDRGGEQAIEEMTATLAEIKGESRD